MCYENKQYLIAGGSSGIGFETAKLLASKGARVILVSSNEDKLRSALDALNDPKHLAICCDLCNPENISVLFSQLRETGIILDGMVYCAGIAPLCLLRDNTIELMNRVFSINTMSFIEMVRGFDCEDISAYGGKIVAVSSITAHGAGYRQILYGASKAAMVSAVKIMSKDLMKRNIRINCISPGVVETPILDKLRMESHGLDEKIKSNQLLGIIPAKNVASAILYMLGEGLAYQTGTEWFLDAGANLK